MRGICFRWWARWLMPTDNASFLQELCWAAAAAWRHLLRDAPPPLDIPQGEGWSGDAAEGLRRALHNNSLLSTAMKLLTFAFLLDDWEKRETVQTPEVSKLAKTSRQKCLKLIKFTNMNWRRKFGGESVSNHRNWRWIWWLQVASDHSCSAVSISSWM